MAVVYKGIQPSLNRAVAIKVLPPQFASTPELLGRFDREASIVAQLNHSNIVQVIDRGRQGKVLYIVMEFVDGEGLDKIIRSGRLEVSQIIDYAAQVCDGLDYAHSMGVIHRDLKPSNILIEKRTGRVKIADFGIAQIETTGGVLATLTYDHSAIGTMNYMSPEQRQDAHRVTHLTDIFSFGVVFYEMITAKLPIGHFKPASLIRPDIPLGFDTIVTKCLAESPTDRYQSAGEIRDDLIRLTGHHPKSQKPAVSILGRLNKRQRWHAFGAVAAGVFLVVTAVVVALVRSSREPLKPAAPPKVATAVPATPAAMAPAVREPAAGGESQEMMEAKVEGNYARAQGLISQGSFAPAVRILEDLIEHHPTHPMVPEFQFALGSALYDAGEKEKCKLAYDRLIRDHPESARLPDAMIAKCKVEWETAPRKRHLFGADECDAAFQQRLAAELDDLLKKKPQGKHVAPALELKARIAEAPAWANMELVADTLMRLYEQKAGRDPEPLYRAAGLYDNDLRKPDRAAAAYERFLKDFPDDKRSGTAKERVAKLKPSAAGSPGS